MYQYIHHSLKGYFSTHTQESIEVGVLTLLKHSAESSVYKTGLISDLKLAYGDSSLSWLDFFKNNDVEFEGSEEEARAFSIKLFGAIFNPKL